MKLFGKRSVRLVVGYLDLDAELAGTFAGIDLSGLDIAFDVKKTLQPKPNVAAIRVRNMNEDHRRTLETSGVLTVELHVGYNDDLAVIYRGEMRAAVTSREGTDLITTIASGDKKGQFAGKTLRVPLGEGASAGNALEQLARSLAGEVGVTKAPGVGAGNLASVIAGPEGSKTLFPVGGALSGNAASLLTSLCRAAGLEWSIQDGSLQFLKLGQPLANEEAFSLGSDSGLVDKVAISNKGFVRAKSLIVPGLKCGSKVVFDTETALYGGYRVEKIHYQGDTVGKNFYASIEAKRY